MAWAGFSFLLASIYLLRLPRQPASSRYIGYQAYDPLPPFSPPAAAAPGAASNDAAAVPQLPASGPPPSTPPAQDGRPPQQQQPPPPPAGDTAPVHSSSHGHSASFPLDIYAPMLPNHAPITEITVLRCLPLPFLPCRPSSTRAKDNRLGKWVRVERALDPDVARSMGKGAPSGLALGGLFGSLESRFLFYRKSRRQDVGSLVVDVRLVPAGQAKPDGNEGWHRVKSDLRSPWMHLFGGGGGGGDGESSDSFPLHLYYRTVKTRQEAEALGLEPLTEVDLVYGPNPPWPGFEVVGQISAASRKQGRSSVHLAVRRKPLSLHMPPSPELKPDGTFKILQLADMHLSVNHEPCRDVAWDGRDGRKCVSDNSTLEMVERWLDQEKPDLVVLTGDQLNGQATSWDELSVLSKLYKPIIDRKIPHAAIPGNHDSQSGTLTRTQQWAAIERLPYAYTRTGPTYLHDGQGAGNFYLHLLSPTPDRTHVFTLYFVDSGTTRPKGKGSLLSSALKGGSGKPNGYDWIRPDQRSWFAEISEGVKRIVRPYTPDGARDLPKQDWGGSGGARRPRRRRPRRLDTHGEAEEEEEEQQRRRRRRLAVRAVGGEAGHPSRPRADWDAATMPPGSRLAKPWAVLFAHIPLPSAFGAVDRDAASGAEMRGSGARGEDDVVGAQGEGGIFEDILAQKERDVEVVVNGHMHLNNDCRHIGIWHCFGGGSSFAAYGSPEVKRMARVLRIERFGERLVTYHVVEDGAKTDEMVLLGQGAMVAAAAAAGSRR